MAPPERFACVFQNSRSTTLCVCYHVKACLRLGRKPRLEKENYIMKQGIHPEYMECTVKCSCGNTFTTKSTKPELKIDICNVCHPFYTGQQRFVDTGGRVQRFADKFGAAKETVAEREAAKKAARAAAIAEAEAKKKAEREAKAAEKAKRAEEFAKKSEAEAKKAAEAEAAAETAPEATAEEAAAVDALVEEAPAAE